MTRLLAAALISFVFTGCSRDNQQVQVEPPLNPTFYGTWKSECVAESHKSRQSVIVLGAGGSAKVWERVYTNTECRAPEEFTAQTRMRFNVLSTMSSTIILELTDLENWPPFPTEVSVLSFIATIQTHANETAIVRLFSAIIKDESGNTRELEESELTKFPAISLSRPN